MNKETDKTTYWVDSRDRKKYETVRIGKQIWMAKNLAFKVKKGNCWAYDDYSVNVSKCGYLYDWETAKKAVPEGWHLPSKAEFEALLREVGGAENAFKALFLEGSSGFNAILCGFRNRIGEYKDQGSGADFWSATKEKKDLAWKLGLFYGRKSAGMYVSLKQVGLSVRLLKD